jgi:hypothetical protein
VSPLPPCFIPLPSHERIKYSKNTHCCETKSQFGTAGEDLSLDTKEKGRFTELSACNINKLKYYTGPYLKITL